MGCTGCDLTAACTVTVPPQYQSTQPYCSLTPSTVDVCSPATVCQSSTDNGCYASGSTVPAYVLAPSVITSLESAQYNGHAIIGDYSTGGCGGGDPAQFLQDFGGYMSTYIRYAEYAGIAFCCVQGISVFAAFVLVCTFGK